MFASLLLIAALAAPSPEYDVTIKKTPAVASADSVDVSRFACKIYLKNAMGSGVNTAKGVVTCLHVVQNEPSIEVVCGDERATAIISVIDRGYDLALLTVAWKQPHPAAELADKSPASGDKLRSAGRCKDGTITVEDHVCESNDRTDIYFTNCSNTGRSGAGIFNADGRLVGIIHGNAVKTEPYSGLAKDINHVVRLGSQFTPGKPALPASSVANTPPVQSGNCPGGVCPVQNYQQQPYFRRRR